MSTASGNNGPVSYSKDIQPIWDKICVGCHVMKNNPFDPRPGTSYNYLTTKKKLCAQFMDKPLVVPGKPEESVLWRALQDTAKECMRAMPPSFDESGPVPYPEGGLKVYDPAAFAKVEQWIKNGAKND
jgi:hypothetical protein